MDLDRETATARRRARRVHSQEEMARCFGFELLAAADQNRHSLRLQPGNQGSGRSRNHGKAGAGGAAHSSRIAASRRGAGVDLQNVSRLQVDSGISPGLRGRDGEGDSLFRQSRSGTGPKLARRTLPRRERIRQPSGKGTSWQTPGWALQATAGEFYLLSRRESTCVKVAPASRRLSGGRPAQPSQASRRPALHELTYRASAGSSWPDFRLS